MPQRWLIFGLITVPLVLPSRALSAGGGSFDPLAGIDARIETHRKANATITVSDAAGRPVPAARVEVDQTRHAFLFGSNIFREARFPHDAANAAYRRRFAALLNYATLPFYWSNYEPKRGEPAHARTEEVARWCRQKGITTKGHPLAWNSSDPAWLGDDWQETQRLQLERIDDCVSRFRGLIDRWDVINEVTHFDREEFARQKAPKYTAMWKSVGQIELARQCFARARKAAPAATLLINDYRTDEAYERVIEQLVDESGTRLYDVIGIQSHMHGGTWPADRFWEVCQRFSRFGVPLHFTEMTIVSGDRSHKRSSREPWRSTPEGEAYQAREVEWVYRLLFSHPAVEAITWWDFSDANAWQDAPAGFLRADMTAKPAYETLNRLIKQRWWTRTQSVTDNRGQSAVRGFLGDYRVTATLPSGQRIARSFTLTRGDNRWSLGP